MDAQAQDRAHRIGQTKPVLIFRLVSAHTIEEKIMQRAAEKRKLEALVIAKGAFLSASPHLASFLSLVLPLPIPALPYLSLPSRPPLSPPISMSLPAPCLAFSPSLSLPSAISNPR
jgi:phosphoribosylcarboxyaminoimidazole (NCAIR) mutase